MFIQANNGIRLATGAVSRCALAAAIAGCALAYAAETCSSKLPRAKKFAPLLGDLQTVIFFSPSNRHTTQVSVCYSRGSSVLDVTAEARPHAGTTCTPGCRDNLRHIHQAQAFTCSSHIISTTHLGAPFYQVDKGTGWLLAPGKPFAPCVSPCLQRSTVNLTAINVRSSRSTCNEQLT